MKNDFIKLFLSIVFCNLIGTLSSVFTYNAISEWYIFLEKPFFSPPNWIFAPVWTILYILMGISLYWIWQKYLDNKSSQIKLALIVFFIQLFLNGLWSYLFFGLHSPFLAFIEIILLWIFIIITILKFYSIYKKAGIILLPYLCWVSFAMILNFYLWQLNL